MHNRRDAAEVRTAGAILAATLGVFLCLVQRHVTSLATLPDHRCSLCLLAATGWMMMESAHLLLPLKGRAR